MRKIAARAADGERLMNRQRSGDNCGLALELAGYASGFAVETKRRGRGSTMDVDFDGNSPARTGSGQVPSDDVATTKSLQM